MTLRLLWTELRENSLWALIALAAGRVIIFFGRSPELIGGLSQRLLPNYYAINLIQGGTLVLPLLWSAGLMFWFCVAWGAALGLAQHFVEQRRGTYQVLATLPVTRGQVFAAKAGAGVLLYLLGAGLPFALLVLRAALPGHYPSPFRWWMAGPGLAAVSTGLAAYAGAFMTAARPARWYVSRGAPLFVGIYSLTGYSGLAAAATALAAAALLLWGGAVSLRRRDL